jgi:hypothetical protein
MNLTSLLVLNIVFQNQNAMIENVVPDIDASKYPPMCLHQSPNDDFLFKFKDSLSQFGLSM